MRELVALLLGREAEGRFEALLGDQLAAGCAVEDIFLRLFQPAARHLGVLWAEDICTFVDVTLAMSLLQGGLRRLAPRLRRHGRSAEGSRSIVLSTLTGDQHTFGLMMTAEFFRRSGWAADVLTSGDGDELLARLRFEQNAIVGFSVSHPDHIPKLAAAIRQLRRLGRDRIAGILVGGPLLITHPGCTRDLGADAVGSDAPQAVMAAERLVSAGAGG